MAENNGSYPDQADPGPKPTSAGSAKFTPIGTFQPLGTDTHSPNSKSSEGKTGYKE